MPGFWTHIIAGKQIIDKLQQPTLKNILENNQKIYNFGCQGPDFLYFNNFWPWLKDKTGNKAGGELHGDDIKPLFMSGVDFIKKEYSTDYFNQIISYFCGFISHFVVDILFHRSILKKVKNSEEHIGLETKLDSYLVKKLWNKEVSLLDTRKSIDIGKELPDYIEQFYKNILTLRTNYNLNLGYISDSYHDFKLFLRITATPGFFKRKIFDIINLFAPWDIKSIIYPSQTNMPVFPEKIEREFNQILSRAVKISDEIMTGIYNYLIYRIKESELQSVLGDYQKRLKGQVIKKKELPQIAGL